MTPALAGDPLVTAVIPAYNVERFIGRTLASALNQTYPHLEIVVVNDGSTDGTLRVVEETAGGHPSVRVISGPNGGLAHARNVGTQAARGFFVAYLDGDDLWHPGKIARQVEALRIHRDDPQWAGCYTLHRKISEDDTVIASGPAFAARGAFFAEHLARNHVGNGSSLMVRRDAALEIGGFDESFRARGLGGCEDFHFQLKLLRRYRLEVAREYLVGYRIHRAQMSHDLEAMERSCVAVIESFPDLPQDLRNKALLSAYRTFASGYARSRDWANTARAAARGLALDPGSALMSLADDLAAALKGSGRKSAQDGACGRPFLVVDPREGCSIGDPDRPGKA